MSGVCTPVFPVPAADHAGGEDALARDWTLSAEDVAETLRSRGSDHRLRFAVELCALRARGRFVEDPAAVPLTAVNFLARQLGLAPVLFLAPAERAATESAQHQRLCAHLGLRGFEIEVEEDLRRYLEEQATEGRTPAELLALAEARLRQSAVVLPAVSTLERLVGAASAGAAAGLFERIAAGLPAGWAERVDALLAVAPGEHRSALGRLKEPLGAAKAPAIAAALDRLGFLEERLGPEDDLGAAVSPRLARHLAGLGRRYDAQALRRFAPAKRHALVAAFLIETRRALLDQVVEMHDQYVTALARTARHAFEAKQRLLRRRARESADVLLGAVESLLGADRQTPVGRLLEGDGMDEGRLRAALARGRALGRLEARGETREYTARYGDLRKYWPAFLRLPFAAAPGSEELLAAVVLLRAVHGGSRPEADLDREGSRRFVPAAWRATLEGADGRLRRALWEVALAFAVRDALRAGDLFLPASRRHVSFWNLVMGERRWAQVRADAYARPGAPDPPAAALAGLRVALGRAMQTAADTLPGNPFATVEEGRLRLRRPDTLVLAAPVLALRDAIGSHLPQVRIEDLLLAVDRWSGFTRVLTPLAGYEARGDPAQTRRALLAAVIAHGTNLGLAAMSASVEDLSAERLQHASRWFLREATLRAASAALVNCHHRLAFSSVWGDGTLSSSDGQRFGVGRASTLSALYPRYFGYYDRALTLYTHVSDQHGVFSTQAISCAPREAAFVLDGLLENDTLLRPQAHTTDTHGYTEQLFGLCHLLGLEFLPRLKDLADQRLYRLERGPDDPGVGPLEPLFQERGRATVDGALIAEQWDGLVRVAASLRERTAPAHVVLQRLINASPADRLARALTALGRLVKTIFILRYVADAALRRRVQTQLNRGEARHALARWLFFANRGEFRTGEYEEIMNKASCLSLLSNAAVLWNTVQMARVVARMRAAAGTEAETAVLGDENLTHVWPLQHARIIPNGTYFLAWPPGQTAPADEPATGVPDLLP